MNYPHRLHFGKGSLFTKDNIDNLLFQLAKEYKKINRKNTLAEIVIIGGAVIVLKYGCPEIVKGFCDADDICYANMHSKLSWDRNSFGKYDYPRG
ncbi:hypothetical protein [Butyrivibrio sp. NC3005]|uniref:hypothetical protein n=1 Tax=Butyrivibrio sp. NC3005 TaxID=1280685 RepID=UPI00056978B8|nr:hypothetical protein [Butyrivibrio sp. NC3005]